MFQRPVKFLIILIGIAVITWNLILKVTSIRTATTQSGSDRYADSDISRQGHLDEAPKLHLLLPVDGPSINLCKLLMGLYSLEYPTPTLVSWDQHGTDLKLLAGGTHLTKISSVHEYLQTLSASSDNDLVVMLDAIDLWVQLHPSVLIQRYQAALAKTLSSFTLQKNGKHTASIHQLTNSILFGSGKKCAPMQYHTIACYPMPDSPLPNDLYGANTDSVLGRELYFSYRQRYLNSGFIMGSVGAMRKMFAEAQRRVEISPLIDPEDNGSGTSKNLYRGSDQSIFARMLGRQEWTREALRVNWNRSRDHNRFGSLWSRLWPKSELKPRQSVMHGLNVDNVLEPSFTHESMNYTEFQDNPGQFEFGITLDYWSDIVHQTNLNSEADARWLVMGESETREANMIEQIEKSRPRNKFDCPNLRIPTAIPSDMENMRAADIPDWVHEKLYMHICLGRIPVFVHRNTINSTGFKPALETEWHNMWYLQRAKARLVGEIDMEDNTVTHRDFKMAPQHVPGVIAWTQKGRMMNWHDVCPAEWETDLFPT